KRLLRTMWEIPVSIFVMCSNKVTEATDTENPAKTYDTTLTQDLSRQRNMPRVIESRMKQIAAFGAMKPPTSSRMRVIRNCQPASIKAETSRTAVPRIGGMITGKRRRRRCRHVEMGEVPVN